MIAIVARSRPLAVPVVALFYGYLRQGAQLMNIRTDVPSEVIGVVTAIIILLVASSFSIRPRAILARLDARRRAAGSAAAEAPQMIELLRHGLSAAFFVTVIRTSTPLLLATLGGLVADLSGALNVALEGMMLVGCLTAVIVSVYAPWYVAVLAALGGRRPARRW